MRAVLELAKPRITSVVLFTTGMGALVAPGPLDPLRGAILLVATALVVASANAFNCVIEKETDGMMRRTRTRPLPDGRVSTRTAVIFGVSAGLVSIPTLWFQVNPLTAVLGLIALVVYVAIYTPMKRVSSIALFVGAIPGAMPPLMGWTGVTGNLDPVGLVLFAILFVWQIPHFIAIALYLKEDYGRAGLKVLPLVSGDVVARRHLFAWTVALIPTSLLLVPLGVTGLAYLLAAALLGGVFLVLAATGLRAEVPGSWARRTFLYSLVYLTVLATVLVIDAA